MPVYILLSTLTEHGVSCIVEDPACLRQISLDIEQLGVMYPTAKAGGLSLALRH